MRQARGKRDAAVGSRRIDGRVQCIGCPGLLTDGTEAITKRKSRQGSRLRLEFDVLHAYQRHYGSTTQREDAAADLGMDLATFRSVLDHARRLGFDVEAGPT